MEPSDPGPLAIPLEERADRWRRGASPQAADPRLLAAGLGTRPPSPAEVAQATLFEEMLCAEIARLQQLATIAADRWAGRGRRGRGGQEPPDETAAELHACLQEARSLLEALRRRFLPGLPIEEPPVAD